MSSVIVFIMGVSGSGKTTIGKRLSVKMGIPFFDGDDFHSPLNKKKMNAGRPLTDEDRAEWLLSLNGLAIEQMKKDGAIIACSALKERYRVILGNGITVPLFWVFLQGGYHLIEKRMQARKNHFMPPTMLASQFDALEIPQQCVTVDISNEPDDIVDAIVSQIGPV